MAETTERFEMKVVTDWNQIPDGPALELDYTEDAWEYGAPPPRNVYDFKMFPGKEVVKMGQTDARDPKTAYFTINYEAKVVGGEYDGASVYGSLDTRVRRGKGISTAAGFLVKAGLNIENTLKGKPATEKNIAMLCSQLLKAERIIKGELDWRGSYSYKNNKGDDEWVNVFNHYEEFPIDKDGSRKHVCSVNSKGGGIAEVRAQARITRFFGKGDTLPTFGGATASGPAVLSIPNAAPVAAPVAMPSPVAAPAPQFVSPQQTASAPVSADGDLELMLS